VSETGISSKRTTELEEEIAAILDAKRSEGNQGKQNTIVRKMSINRSISQSVSQSVSLTVSQSVSQSVRQSVSQSVRQSVSDSFNPSFNDGLCSKKFKIPDTGLQRPVAFRLFINRGNLGGRLGSLIGKNQLLGDERKVSQSRLMKFTESTDGN